MRKICVVTGTRAEYGMLTNVMSALKADDRVELQVVVTGAHLSPRFGSTWEDIQRDGFPISAKVEMLDQDDTPGAIARAMGRGTIGMADALERLSPDIVVLLGDRSEILCAAQTAMALRIPIAHIHGGEVTLGAIDEAIRHSVTKMAHLHYVAGDAYRHRVIQLGENPDRVRVVGALGLDSIDTVEPMSRKELEASLGLPLGTPLFVVTCHPETLQDNAGELADALVAGLEAFPAATVIVTSANADAGYQRINAALQSFAASHAGRVLFVENLGQRRYLNLVREADAMIGNSSSGILEAPSLGTPSVNIGIRQDGRLRSPSVIDCEAKPDTIRTAIAQAISPEFQAMAARKESPYGTPGGGARVAQHLASVDLDGILLKRFYDVDWVARH